MSLHATTTALVRFLSVWIRW